MAETVVQFSDTFQAHLLSFADERDHIADPTSLSGVEILAQLDNLQYAPSSMESYGTTPYVRLGKTEGRTVLYVPGFAEGIEAKVPTVIEMVKNRGIEVILPDQNRRQILIDATTGRKDATYSQARNYLDVLQAEGLADQPGSVDIVTHSYGALIFDAMHKIAERDKLPCFKGSTVIMTAPAGLNANEQLLGLGWRFLYSAASEAFAKKDFLENTKEVSKEMFWAGIFNAGADMRRTAREVFELATKQVDYNRLLHSDIGRLAVVSFAEDEQFPVRVLERSMGKVFAATNETGVDVSWATPISLQSLNDSPRGPIRGGRGASHNDDQFNPARVAGAVAQILAA